MELQSRAVENLAQRKSPPGMVDITMASSTASGLTATTGASSQSSIISTWRNTPKATSIQSTLPTTSPNVHNSFAMDVAYADFVFSNNLAFSITTCPKLNYLRNLARTIPSTYTPPDRNKVGGVLLDTLHDTYYDKCIKLLRDNGLLFDVTCFGDGATIKTVPLVNMMACGVHIPAAVLDVADCTDHVAEGGLKDATYLANLFLPLIVKLEGGENGKWKGMVDLLFFDGASNVKKSGRIIQGRHPNITLGHGAEHISSFSLAMY